MNTTIKIVDNFLPKDIFQNVKDNFLSNNFPYFYSSGIVKPLDPDFQFTHILFENNKINSNYFDFLLPIINKLDCKAIIKIKTNLTTKTQSIRPFIFHNDYDFKCTTSVFYINSNNGKTLFEDGSEVDSVENRMVIFPSTIKHTGTTHTDENIRVVINFNYF
jgi:hypothetical protein